MVSEQPTRRVVKQFRAAGWVEVRTRGSHTTWACRGGKHQFVLPDGHRTISPGVYAKALKALSACDCKEGE